MTQNTQTTAGRIRAQIYYQLHGEFYSLETANEEVTRVANTIAAEIDTLTRERDEAQKGWEHYQARAEIAEGERDRYAKDAALMCAVWNSYRDLLPGVRAELSKARAEVERL